MIGLRKLCFSETQAVFQSPRTDKIGRTRRRKIRNTRRSPGVYSPCAELSVQAQAVKSANAKCRICTNSRYVKCTIYAMHNIVHARYHAFAYAFRPRRRPLFVTRAELPRFRSHSSLSVCRFFPFVISVSTLRQLLHARISDRYAVSETAAALPFSHRFDSVRNSDFSGKS